MPRLSLPRISIGSLAALGERTTLLYGIYTTILFLVFLFATLPFDILIRQGIASLPPGTVSIEFDGARFAWHRGLQVDGVRISAVNTPLKAPLIEVEHLYLRPNLGALLRGSLSAIMLDADLYGGTASGSLVIDGPVVQGQVNADGLSLGRVSVARAYLDEGTLAGRMNVAVAFESAGREISKANAKGNLSIKGASMEKAKVGGFGVPDLHFADIGGEFELQGERLEIGEFHAQGQELNVNSSGQVSLREPLPASILNLKASVVAGESAPDSIKGLTALLPKPAAGQDPSFKITGSIASPKVAAGK